MLKHVIIFCFAVAPIFVVAADDEKPSSSSPDETAAASAAQASGESKASDSSTKGTDESKPTEVPVAKDDPAASKDPTTGTGAKYPVDGEDWLNADPLLIIDTEMNSVVNDMRDGDLFRPHTDTQPRIIARFDKLIELLERKKTGVGSATPNSSMPAEVSGIRNGSAEAGELTAKDDKTGAMDKLPPNQRKKIQQAAADGFPPGFEDVLSDYFRRLAETKAAE